jgi:N-acetylglucosaminyl-diphospho-decaprenol L-rhamnosyltransferase
MSPSIDVVVPACNRFELTDSCLRHLQVQTVAHKVIVVDDGSTDGTSARLREGWPEVHVEHFEVTRGFAQACNRGVAAGSGEIAVLLNNDVECRADFLERLVAPIGADPGVGAVAALMLQPGEQAIDSIGLCADATLSAFPRLQGLPAARAADTKPLLACPAGAAAAYRRSAWREVGGLDGAMFAYMEDFDLGLRLRAAGWRAVTAPAAVGVHLGSATHGHRSARQRQHGGFGRGYILRRYGVLRGRQAPRALLTEAVVIVGDVLMSRDAAALRGRLDGWRAGRGRARRTPPSIEVIDPNIGFRDSLALRRGVYGHRAARDAVHDRIRAWPWSH